MLGAQAKCLCSVHALTGFPNPPDLRVAVRAGRKLPLINQATWKVSMCLAPPDPLINTLL